MQLASKANGGVRDPFVLSRTYWRGRRSSDENECRLQNVLGRPHFQCTRKFSLENNKSSCVIDDA